MMRLLNIIPIILLLAACNTETNINNDTETTETTDIRIETSNVGVSVSDAWVRKNAPGQTIGAAYMTLNSPQTSTLVYAEATDVAGSVEIHSMSMNNGVMKMRMLEELLLEANQPKALAPGGLHLMMFNLKKPLEAGQNVTFRLCFKDEDGKITDQHVTLPIKAE